MDIDRLLKRCNKTFPYKDLSLKNYVQDAVRESRVIADMDVIVLVKVVKIT